MRPKKVDMCASKKDCVFQWTRAGRVLPEIAKKAKKQSKKDFVLQCGSCHLCYKHLCLVAPQARLRREEKRASLRRLGLMPQDLAQSSLEN